MTTFKKIPIGVARSKLAKLNSNVMKRAKKASIQQVDDLDIDPALKKAFSIAMPTIEKIRKSGLEKNVKSALIADIISNIELPSTRQESPIKPQYSSTPFKSIVKPLEEEEFFSYTGQEKSALDLFPKIYNSRYEVVDKQGDVIPNSDMNRVLSFLEKSRTKNTRGPPGTPYVLENLAELAYKLEKIGDYIKNHHATTRLLNARERLIELERRNKKQLARIQNNQTGGKWKSLRIKY